ncbi:MAG: tol-pal system protein YbgF [Bradyrhizobium sp.]
MLSRFHRITGIAGVAALLALSSLAQAQSDGANDPELRIQQLEDRLRQVTGQNEELQHQNRLLEQRLQQVQGGVAPGAPVAAAQPGAAATPTTRTGPAYGQPQAQPAYAQPQTQPTYVQRQPAYRQPQIAAPAPIIQEPQVAGSGRGHDAFDPSQHPNAPGAPRPLGGGQLPISAQPGVVGAPLNLGGAAPVDRQGGLPPPPPIGPSSTGALVTLPPTNKPRDEYELGIGYMERKNYALAGQTMQDFARRFPADPLVGDSQYWLGESYYQRRQYRDAAEAFLTVTTKYDKSTKAPDALLRLGQSLAALKQKEAACASFGEVLRKYPRASAGVKAAVDREQKKEKC